MFKLALAMLVILFGTMGIVRYTKEAPRVQFNVSFADGRKDVCDWVSVYPSGFRISGCESKTEYHEVDPKTVLIGGK